MKIGAAAQEEAEARTGGLSVLGLAKRYARVTALDHVSLDVGPGEFLTLLGPSGSGKTTLLMAIAGFVTPDSGSLRFAGRDITRTPPERRNFGMVFQGYALFPHLTVNENVGFALRMRGVPADEISRRVGEALSLVNLSDKAARLPKQLSGGQQQRVALARAIAFRPHLLLLDEPLSALDAQLRGQLQTELKALHRAVGMTFIYVTHDQGEALSMSDRVAVMNDGKLVQIGTPPAIFSHPANRFVAEFLGVENLLPGRVLKVAADTVSLEVGPSTFDLPRPDAAGFARGDAVLLGLRADALGLGGAPDERAQTIVGDVIERSYFGTTARYTVRSRDGAAIRATVPVAPHAPGPTEGQQITLTWRAEDAVLVPAEPSLLKQ